MKSNYSSINRSGFIEKLISRQQKFGSEVIQEASRKIFEQLSYALSQGQRIEIRGFGSFCLRHRSERTARNPRTGEQFRLQRRSVPYFKPGKSLRDKVDGVESASPDVSESVDSSPSSFPEHG